MGGKRRGADRPAETSTISAVTSAQTPRPKSARADPPEIAALRKLKAEQPDLAAAVDLEIDLAALRRRVHGRISTPWLEFQPDWVVRRFAAGRPLLQFDEIPFEWTELRLLFRQISDVLYRHHAIEPAEHTEIQARSHAGMPTVEQVSAWYAETMAPSLAPKPSGAADEDEKVDTFRQILSLAARPFLSRPVELVQHRIDLAAWQRAYCPFCGGEPELAVLTHAGERHLICGRCAGVWPFAQLACPYCGDEDREHIRSFASRDGHYRLFACDTCRRYLKAYDARAGDRPAMLSVDSIATLPLDAAAIQRGYRG